MKNKIFNILVIIVLLVLAAILIFEDQIGDLDELWQYSFANNMYNGLIPYKDFNIIVTPFFPLTASLFLRVFSNQLIVMRIFNTVIFTAILYAAYKIFYLLKVSKIKSLFFTFILYVLFYFNLGVEYNYLILLIALISLYFELYNIKKYGVLNLKNNFWLGILIGLTVVTKHTIGIFLSTMFVFYKAIFIKDKKDYSIFKKIILYRILGILLPSSVLLIYLLYHHSLYDCISYCVLGITEFKNKVLYFNLFLDYNMLIQIFAFIMPIFLTSFIALLRYRKNINIIEILTMQIYSITMFIGIYPIADNGHFIIYGFIGIIATIYSIYIITRKIIINKKIKKFISEFVNFFCICYLAFYILISCINLVKLYKNNYICKNELEHYYGILINKELIEEINSIDKYIYQKEREGNTVYILDASAVLYRIPMNAYYKDYDMFNKGNFGKNGESRIIEEIEKATNTTYLILQDQYIKNWQTPLDIIDYVKNNKSRTGKIEIFDIYE